MFGVLAVELAVAWQSAIEYKETPSCSIFSRQSLPHVERDEATVAGISKGGYILKDTNGTPDVIVIATGSEVQLVLEAAEQSDKKVRVVSMPSTTEFDEQSAACKESVLPAALFCTSS